MSFQVNSRKYEIYLNIFWIGMLLYTLGSIIFSIHTLDIKICEAMEIVGIIAMIPTGIFLGEAKIDSGYLKTIFILYIIWVIAIIFRGHNFSFDYEFIKEFLFGSNSGGLIYFAPLILLFPRRFTYYKKLFDFIFISSILYFLLCIILIKKILVSGENLIGQGIIENLFDLVIPSTFIMLTYLYHSNKRNLFAIVSIFITLLLIIVRARRGLIFITTSLISYSALFYFFYTKKKLFIIYFSILFLCIISAFSNNIYNIQNNKFIHFLYERGNEDTRSAVEIFLYDDMKPNDWIAGRGISGSYFCPDCEVSQNTNYRTVIETGYLQVILKGGIISLGLLLLITIPAFFQGVFFSKNILSKAAGMWIFQFMLNLYPQNSVSFSFSYFMVWICVGICYSKQIRNMSDDAIKNILQSI